MKSDTKYQIIGTVLLVCLAAITGCKSSNRLADKGPQKAQERVVTDEILRMEAMLIDAKMQQQIEQDGKALTTYRQMLKTDSEYGAALYGISQILAMSRLDSAVFYAERAIASEKNNVWYHIWTARLYEITGELQKHAQEWETIVKLSPSNIEYYYELSNSYIKAQNLPKAISSLSRVEKIIGYTEEISMQKQRLWNAMGKPSMGLKEIENLAKTYPQNSRYSALLANAYMQAKEYAKAKQYLDQLLETNPRDEYIHISLADYYKATKDEEKMFSELKKGFANSLISTDIKLQLLNKFYPEDPQIERSPKAIELLQTIMEGNPDTTAYALIYSSMLLSQGKYADAARQIKLHLSKDSSQWTPWETLLQVEMELENNEDEMLSIAKRASALFPFEVLPHYIMAYCHLAKEQHQQSIDEVKQCEKLGFSKRYLKEMECEAYNMAAHCYEKINDFDNCEKYHEKAIGVCPSDPLIANSYAYYLAERHKDLEKAEKLSAMTLKADPQNPYFLDTYAWILYQMGRYDEARKYIKQAIVRPENENEDVRKHYQLIMGK